MQILHLNDNLHYYESYKILFLEANKEMQWNRRRLDWDECLEHIEKGDFKILLAVEDQKVIGFQSYYKSYYMTGEPSINLCCIYIHSNYRRKGVASALLNYFKDLSIKQITINKKNRISKAMFLKKGFTLDLYFDIWRK